MDVGEAAYEFEDKTSVVMVIGVNGVGKTTTIGKLAGKLRAQNKKVILAAADTLPCGGRRAAQGMGKPSTGRTDRRAGRL